MVRRGTRRLNAFAGHLNRSLVKHLGVTLGLVDREDLPGRRPVDKHFKPDGAEENPENEMLQTL
jgi:hypothetical protein